MDDRDKRIAELERDNQTLARAIDEMREQMQSIGNIAAAFRRMPIRDLSDANIKRNQ